MGYQRIALPATGGGIVLISALGIVNIWTVGILSIFLIMTVIGFVKLKKGQKDLNFPRN